MTRCLIGIDVGTTGTKSLLVSERGEILGHAYQGYALSAPRLSRHEQDAEDWWRALVKTVRALLPHVDDSRQVTAISLSTQGGTLVPADRDLRPLRPAIVWSDTRCEAERQAFAAQFGEEYLYEKSGWHLSRGLNALQIAWIKRNEPDVFNQAVWFLSVHDYLSLKLTGIAAVDMSNAGINQLADIREGTYDQDILRYLGIKASVLPRIVPSGAPIGELTDEAARELGLAQPVLLVSGAHDQYAGLLGAGVTQASEILIGSGTAWVVTALADQPDFSTGFSQSRSAVPDKWGMLVALSTGGSSLDWLLKNILAGNGSSPADYGLLEQAAKRAPGAGGLMFFPSFNGAFFPVADAESKASFVGLDLSHDRVDMVRAVMEGIACHIAWILEKFREKVGEGTLKLSGGASKSKPWCQMVADMTNQDLRIPTVKDLPCLGAAILAGVGSGVFRDIPQANGLFSAHEELVKPDPGRATQYAAYQTLYRSRAYALGAMYRL